MFITRTELRTALIRRGGIRLGMCLIASMFASMALAGSYTVAYAGGSAAIDTGRRQYTTPYSATNGGWGGAFGGSFASITCSGQITATLTWSPSSDPRPPVLIIKESASASGDNTCNDGFSDPTVNGGSSAGDHWSVVVKPDAVLTYHCSPAAFSNGGAGGAIRRVPNILYDPISAGVFYSVTPYVIQDTVTIGPRLKALAWNDTTHSQDAAFSCTNSVSGLPANCSWTGSSWSADGAGFTFEQVNNPNTTGHASQPTQYKVTATAHITTPNGQHIDVPAFDYCAVFGGPLAYAALPGDGTPWTQDNNNDITKPYYLQSFYTHTQAVSGTMQHQQTYKVKMLNQPGGTAPAGTTMTWNLPGFLYTADSLVVTGTSSTVTVTADSPGLGAVTCSLHCKWLDPTASTPSNPVYVEADGTDDTASSKISSGGGWVPMPNQLHGHRPSSLTYSVTGTPQGYFTNDASGNAVYAFAETDYNLALTDDSGGAMPAVWINERFDPTPNPIPAPPGGFKINTINDYWITMSNGISSNPDKLSMPWDSTMTPWITYSFTHTYWAASRQIQTTPPSTEGFQVGSATMIFSPGNPTSNPRVMPSAGQ